MFRKLRLKLTMINVLVVAFLFLLVLMGTYSLAQRGIYLQSQRIMHTIANQQGQGSELSNDTYPPHDFKKPFPGFRRGTEYFYVNLNPQNQIARTSSNVSLTSTQLKTLVNKALSMKKNEAELKAHGTTYRFLISHGKTAGKFIVFFDTEPEKEIIGHISTAIGITGAGCLILVFFASLFMADRALIPIKTSWQRQKDFVADAST